MKLGNTGQKIGKAVGVRDLVEKSEPGSHKAKATNDPAGELYETTNDAAMKGLEIGRVMVV